MSKFNEISDINKINIDVVNVVKNRFTEVHVQNVCTFDIEASNGFRTNGSKIYAYSHKKAKKMSNLYKNAVHMSLMYHWQFSIKSSEGKIYAFHGRTWGEYESFMEELSKRVLYGVVRPGEKFNQKIYDKSVSKIKNQKIKILCFIHNEGYEYQHLRNIWESEFIKNKSHNGAVFARQERSPMKFNLDICKVNWEFRDSYVLTGMSLKSWTKDLAVSKLDEPVWFYNPIRTPETPLDQEMIDYCYNDVISMQYGLEEYAKEYDDVFDIPLTQTGIVRRQAVKNIAEANKEWSEHCKAITSSITWEEYLDLMDLFAGGWTHANSIYTNETQYNVQCYDFASSYPACLTERLFPLTKFTLCDESEYEWLLSLDLESMDLPYHYWIEFECEKVRSLTCNTWWSSSKVVDIKGGRYDNGKIYAASSVRIKMTDMDFDTFQKAYSFENLKIHRMYKAEAGLLPKEFILLILQWYGNKTSFKNVEGKEALYNSSKRSINGIYGCCVTRDYTDDVVFGMNGEDSGWTTKEMTEQDYYNKLAENMEKPQWNLYQIGVWCTAWARHNLWKVMLSDNCKGESLDVKTIYCDTDSCKGLYDEDDLKWFELYNKHIFELQQYVADYYNFDVNLFRPKDPKGIERPLGIFADDGFDLEFRTLGAKRYAVLTKNKKGKLVIEATIAGLPKKAGAEKLTKLALKQYGKLTVDVFDDGIVWDSDESGKLISYYCDNQDESLWHDMYGNEYLSHDRYGICLMPTTFDMSMTEEYEALISALQYGIKNNHYFENYTNIYSKYLLN